LAWKFVREQKQFYCIISGIIMKSYIHTYNSVVCTVFFAFITIHKYKLQQ